jgi:hypothetical protein
VGERSERGGMGVVGGGDGRGRREGGVGVVGCTLDWGEGWVGRADGRCGQDMRLCALGWRRRCSRRE